MIELKGGDKRLIRMIVDGYHVSAPNKVIMREFWDRPIFKVYPKYLRKEVYQYAIECHKHNQELYNWVMSSH